MIKARIPTKIIDRTKLTVFMTPESNDKGTTMFEK
jgi:hypothetical protein